MPFHSTKTIHRSIATLVVICPTHRPNFELLIVIEDIADLNPILVAIFLQHPTYCIRKLI